MDACQPHDSLRRPRVRTPHFILNVPIRSGREARRITYVAPRATVNADTPNPGTSNGKLQPCGGNLIQQGNLLLEGGNLSLP